MITRDGHKIPEHLWLLFSKLAVGDESDWGPGYDLWFAGYASGKTQGYKDGRADVKLNEELEAIRQRK